VRERIVSDREQLIRAIAHHLWEESGRPSGQETVHWEAARRLAEAQTAAFALQKPVTQAQTQPTMQAETSMRTVDEIVAETQKAVEHAIREAFNAGRDHTASELKRRMVALFEGLISGEPGPTPDATHGEHHEQHEHHEHH
jgi:Protein of unknown function (DUF2934)